MKKIILMFCLVNFFVASNNAFAQQDDAQFLDESLKDMTMVAGLGLGGAILGLSTLSFVEEPGDHLKNIVVGGAIGIIIGVGVVAFSQATKSKELYENNAYNQLNFSTGDRVKWHSAQNTYSNKVINASNLSQFNYTFSF